MNFKCLIDSIYKHRLRYENLSISKFWTDLAKNKQDGNQSILTSVVAKHFQVTLILPGN